MRYSHFVVDCRLRVVTSLSLIILVLNACTDVGDPYAGIPADSLKLEIDHAPLPADGRTPRLCKVEIDKDLVLYSTVTISASSASVRFSLTGELPATPTLTVPMSESHGQFYLIAPPSLEDNFVRVTAMAGLLHSTVVLPLKASRPTLLYAPARVSATVDQAFSLTVTLSDSTEARRHVSGGLFVKIDPINPTADTPELRSDYTKAHEDGTATVELTATPTAIGTYRYKVSVPAEDGTLLEKEIAVVVQ